MSRSIKFALSILVCLLLAGPALAQIQQTELEVPMTASPPLGGSASFTQNLDPNTLTSSIVCSGDFSILRLYDLDGEFGLSGSVCAQSIDYAATSIGSLNVTANVYCLNDGDAFILANLTQVGTNTIPQPEPLDFYNIPVGGCCDAATQSMAVQIAGDFSHGANDLGQTAPSYFACEGSEITDLTDFLPDAHMLQVVNYVIEAVPMLSAWSLALLGAGLLAVLALAFTLRRRRATPT